MRKNETILTPLFRAMITVMEENGIDSLESAIYEIEELYRLWSIKDERKSSLFKDASDLTVIYEGLQVLKTYAREGKDAAFDSWKGYGTELKNRECGLCYACKHCILLFWVEWGEILFDVKNEEKGKGIYFPFKRLPQDIEKYFEPSLSLKDIYHRRRRNTDDRLVMLKGMSSSTPAMLNGAFDTDEFAGGGWYFRYNGFGVVIDPGYHFLQNFHHIGLTVMDIDAVVITHEHIDHNSDMRIIDEMKEAAGSENTITWYLDQVSYQVACVYQEHETGYDGRRNKLIETRPGTVIQLTEDIELKTFPTAHIYQREDKKICKHTFGCRFRLFRENEERVLVYTSDTKYYTELKEELSNADIVIANISGIYEDDYLMVKAKDRHLGYFGCRKLLEACLTDRIRYFIISEFWNGTRDIRFSIPRDLQIIAKDKAVEKGRSDGNLLRVIPGEIGLEIDLKTLRIKCDKCGRFSDTFIVNKPSKLYERAGLICGDCYY